MYKKVLISFFICIACVHNYNADESLGKGKYVTTLPPGGGLPINDKNQTIKPYVTDDFSKPIVTNKWWSSLIWKFFSGNNFSQNMFSMPLAYQATKNGLELGYLNQFYVTDFIVQLYKNKTQEYHYTYTHDIIVGVNGMNPPDVKVKDYTDWTVTATWENNNRSLDAILGEGLPFVYFTVKGDNATLSFAAKPTVWSNNNGVIGLTVSGRHYGIFAPAGSNWTNVGTNNMQSNLNGKDYFSIAVLPDNNASTLEFFRQRAYAFVKSTSVEWDFDENSSLLTTTYNIETELKESGNNNINQTLIALRRHHWLYSKDELTNYTYASPRGTLKVVAASSFSTQQTFNGLMPALPYFAKDGVDQFSEAQLYKYIDDIYKLSSTARWNNISSADTYWYGKAFGKIAQLIKIADQIGHTQARDLFVQETKNRLNDWFDGNYPQVFYYNDTWNSLIGYPASYGSDTSLNDHHFHYGYFIQAAATVAMYDTDWVKDENYGQMVKLLIQDVSNWDKSNTQFPYLRHYEIFSGHCWASGSALFASGNNQESSSESMNYSSALILWGSLTNNKTIRDLGIYLYTTEANAIREYWFDVDNQVFPEKFIEPTVGMVWNDGAAYAIFWAGYVEELHGINFLPMTAGSLYLGHYPSYLKTNQDFMNSNAGGNNVWNDIHLKVKALYNPSMAIDQFNANPNYTLEAGDSYAHTYYWIHNINQLGILNTSITADCVHYAVFEKNGMKQYCAFNSSNMPLKVTFSDGFTMNVAPLSYVANNEGISPPNNLLTMQTIDDLENGMANVNFVVNLDLSQVTFNYSVNNGPVNKIKLVNDNNNWNYLLTKLADQSVIDYSFTYVYNNQSFTTDPYQHVYQSLGENSNFSAIFQPLVNGQLKVNFIPVVEASLVTMTYAVNNGAQTTISLNLANDTWSSTLSGLIANDVVNYSFQYVINEKTYSSNQLSYTFGGCSAVNFGDNQAYKQQVQKNSQSGQITITFMPTVSSKYVDIHYKINGGGQQDFRMSGSGTSWTQIINNLKSGDNLTYYFTYEANNLSVDTIPFSYQY